MAADLVEFETVWTGGHRASLLRGELARDIGSAGCLPCGGAASDAADADLRLEPFQFLGRPSVLRRVTDLLSERVPRRVDRVVGVGPGGTVLATAVSLGTGLPFVAPHDSVARSPGDRAVPGFEPNVHRGEAVLLVVDVLNTGVRLVEVAKTLEAVGANVVAVLSVIDRGAGGARLLRSAGYHFEALFLLSDLRF